MRAPIRFPIAVLICLVSLGASAQDAAPQDAAPQVVPPWRKQAQPQPKADLTPPPPSIDWYRPTDSDARVPWNGNAMGRPYDSWRNWRSIGIGFWSRTIPFEKTESDPLSTGYTTTLPAADYELSTVALVGDFKPFGFFAGKTSLKPSTDLYTFGATVGFPWTPLVLDMGLPDVQIGVVLPELFCSATIGTRTGMSTGGEVKADIALFSLGARVAGLRLTVLDAIVAEVRLGLVSLDAEALTLTTPDPAPGATTDITYDFARDRFGFELAPEFRFGVLF